MEYDILILGGGPIGASTAYFLSQQSSDKKIGVITNDPDNDPTVTYKNAGGSIRWFWDEPIKREMTSKTAQFVKKLLEDGVELSALQDTYNFVYRGVHAPSLNIKGALLIQYFLDQAKQNGVTIESNTAITGVTSNDGTYSVETNKGVFKAKKVLLALGVQNEKFMPGLTLEREKRQIFVTDLEVDESRATLPHTIVPVGDGYGYVFIKKFGDDLKVVVGQEDIIEDEDETKAVDYFKELVASPFGDIMPWLKDAHVEKIMWGVDAGNKTLRVEQDGTGLYSANCGSAVRGCVYIGEELANTLSN